MVLPLLRHLDARAELRMELCTVVGRRVCVGRVRLGALALFLARRARTSE